MRLQSQCERQIDTQETELEMMALDFSALPDRMMVHRAELWLSYGIANESILHHSGYGVRGDLELVWTCTLDYNHLLHSITLG